MFKKLYRNIYLPIVLIAVALILFINVFSAIVLTETLKDAYNVVDRNRVSRALDSCELYISSVDASAYNLSLDRELIKELSSPSGNSLVSKLDATCNYSLKINAVTVYSENGAIYTSSQVANVPTLEQLKQTEEIKNFIEGNEQAVVSLRTENVADIYYNTFYPDRMGVVTCCRKVYDGDSVAGYIFADVLPVNLYNYLFANGQLGNAVAFIGTGEIYFEYNGNSLNESLLYGEHSGYFKYQANTDGGLFSITVFNSTKEYRSRLTVLIVTLLAVSALLIVGVHFAANQTAKAVTKRLDSLIDKMNAPKLT